MKQIYILLLAGIHVLYINAQDDSIPKKLQLSGYASTAQSVTYENYKDLWLKDNTLHNRLEFYWYASKNLTFSVQSRTRFEYGDKILIEKKLLPLKDSAGGITSINGIDLDMFDQYRGYSASFASDQGIIDLSYNIVEQNSFLLNFFLDRLWIKYVKNNFEVTIGRQRINWGQTFVWNPNDIFNTYNFFDVDYPERPGSDAIRVQYYTGMTSSAELAFKLDSAKKITTAGLYKFNKWQYDIQFLAGVLSSEDLVMGLGWSGNIKNAAFRGEISYFHPYKNMSDTEGQLIAVIGADYSFDNSLFLQMEFLYSKLPDDNQMSNLGDFFTGTLNVKKISFTDYNLFFQAGYSIAPLLQANIGGMVFLGNIDGYFIGPSLVYSLGDNIDCSLFYQMFNGYVPIDGIEEEMKYNMAMLRIKYNF